MGETDFNIQQIRTAQARSNDLLEAIIHKLDRINNNIEEFLKRDALRFETSFTMPHNPVLPKPKPPESTSQYNAYCAWCMAEIDFDVDGMNFVHCEHATLCMACAPCDECLAEEN